MLICEKRDVMKIGSTLALIPDGKFYFEYVFRNHSVTGLIDIEAGDGKPWFKLADVARAVGITKSSINAHARTYLDKDEKRYVQMPEWPFAKYPPLFISKSGLYKVLANIRKHCRKTPFKNWITSIVLPDIKKLWEEIREEVKERKSAEIKAELNDMPELKDDHCDVNFGFNPDFKNNFKDLKDDGKKSKKGLDDVYFDYANSLLNDYRVARTAIAQLLETMQYNEKREEAVRALDTIDFAIKYFILVINNYR